ncbi:hypothetical protein ACH5RR_041540 [Cinchona calisaya]|uniref:Uncharacterized protein n=1 Tax=Cinchona calisaya TaxID=153742 RepID=A0ABD2XUJ3_9GENT
MDKKRSKLEMKVEILVEKFIKPSFNTPNHLQTLKLSFFDLLVHPSYATLLYYYSADHETVNDTAIDEVSKRLKKLQESLSDVLTRFHPLAGRLVFNEGDFHHVDCQDQGVLYREARLNCQLNEFLEAAYEDLDLITSLAPRKVFRDIDLVIAPLVCVQVNQFNCGGLVIAVEILHTMGDGFTGTRFTYEWAKISRSNLTSEANFSTLQKNTLLAQFDVGHVLPRIDLSNKIKPFPPLSPQLKIVTKRFLFDEATISGLKNEIMASDITFERQPSKVEVVTAFLWSRLVRASQARHGYLRPCMTSISMNLRGKKTALEFHENSFGNVYIPVPIKFIPDDDQIKMELSDFMHLIRDAMQKTLQDLAKASKEEVYSIVINAHNEMRECLSNEAVDARFSTSLCRFPLYEADFGWGKPSWVSTRKLLSEMFVLIDRPFGNGVEVWMNLNEIEMLKLLCDQSMATLISPP